MLPEALVQDLPRGASVVEVGVGRRFQALEALHEARTDLDLHATDVHEDALDKAPGYVSTHVDDVWAPQIRLYETASLLYSIRCPAELQPPLARIARSTRIPLAVNALKDEWAHLDPILGEHQIHRHEETTWRVWVPREAGSTHVTEQES